MKFMKNSQIHGTFANGMAKIPYKNGGRVHFPWPVGSFATGMTK